LGKRVTITVTPSAIEADLLTVEDAMRQVLDYFEFLSRADKAATKDSKPIVWKLIRATTNSPYTVQAEAFSDDPMYIPDSQAEKAMIYAGDAVNAILEKERLPIWLENDNKSEEIIRGILKRNMNGIGRTDIIHDNVEPILISHRTANAGINHLEMIALAKKAEQRDYTHTAFGSVEGVIYKVDTFRGKPSFMIKERLNGKETRCTINKSREEAIGTQHNLQEVWQNKRALIVGKISYKENGDIGIIEAEDISIIEPKSIPAESLYDKDFCNGLSPTEYLNKLREGDLG
jgi:hypothetical protein